MDNFPRELLRGCLSAALAAVDGRRAVAQQLGGLDLPANCPILAVGKAAPAMLAGVAALRGSGAGPALCITRAGAARPGEPGLPGARILEGDHPVPGPRSLLAGQALLAFVESLPPRVPLLCLMSGGSSALVEVLPEGVGEEDLARTNRWLIASGLPIAAVNLVRSRLSALKAGRLAHRLAGRRVVVLAISDVPGDDPAIIGSGPWTAARAQPLPEELPPWLADVMRRAPPQPEPGDASLADVEFHVIASGRSALQAAGAFARKAGVSANLHAAPLQGPVEAAADEILATLSTAPPGLYGWSGETTVRLPEKPGVGGRNSHLALTLACGLSGRDERVVLCAATDGSDGASDAAGGWADGGVLARGAALGLDAHLALARADSGTYLHSTGDALVTGPTGTNVMDLVLALRS